MINKLIKETRDVKLELNSLLSRNKNYTCHYPDCNEKSILSHSISRSTLQIISHNSHVIAAQFDRARFSEKDLDGESINLRFTGIGIDRASTFKGFCRSHDNNVFLNIDKRGIKTKRDIFLQIYRTARYFLFTDLAHSKAELKVLGYEYNSNTEYNDSLSISLKKIVCTCEDLLVGFPELDALVEIKSTETLSIKPLSAKAPLDAVILYKSVKTIFPIALQKCFTLSFDGKHSQSLVVITPDDESTNIIILCHPDVVSQYASCINSKLKLLNFIESVLMHDSDFYLQEDVMLNWSKEKLDIIERDYYFFNERAFLEEYDVSIFDNIRRELCLTLTEKERVIELKKIYSLPERDPLKVRNHHQTLGTIKDRHKKLLHTGNLSSDCYPLGALRIL